MSALCPKLIFAVWSPSNLQIVSWCREGLHGPWRWVLEGPVCFRVMCGSEARRSPGQPEAKPSLRPWVFPLQHSCFLRWKVWPLQVGTLLGTCILSLVCGSPDCLQQSLWAVGLKDLGYHWCRLCRPMPSPAPPCSSRRCWRKKSGMLPKNFNLFLLLFLAYDGHLLNYH